MIRHIALSEATSLRGVGSYRYEPEASPYPDKHLEGSVDSLGWGIAQQDGSTGFDLLPNISPTFEWIRLAQRVPVRIHLDKVPEEVKLRVGTTASVLVMTGTSNSKIEKTAVAAPKALQ